MKVNRSKLIQHLERIMCGGQIKEVIFHDAFAATALTPDHLLMVTAPDLEGAEPLADDLGVAKLDQFKKALGLLQGEGNTGVEVELDFRDGVLALDEGDRGEIELVTAAPKTIATRVEDGTAKKLRAVVEEGDEIALTRQVVDGARGAFALFKPEEVRVTVGPAGVTFRVGNKNSDGAEFTLKWKKKKVEEYTQLFGGHLIDVLSSVTDYSSATLRLGGPEKPIAVEDGNYQYILGPRKESADKKKGKKEKETDEEATE